ncbi:hypothetical protein GCM10010911_47530 [Paenibacillus nasutitermitis]|uniref:Uncharacterized protein n=1 Tax=Paenibacillus nasutitermitis TaxID=1652958 RepID=A0A917E096_9BACL|nr:hypothetical protein GCM10010911_47530 [Paenibacillus nasutitermitis]
MHHSASPPDDGLSGMPNHGSLLLNRREAIYFIVLMMREYGLDDDRTPQQMSRKARLANSLVYSADL